MAPPNKKQKKGSGSAPAAAKPDAEEEEENDAARRRCLTNPDILERVLSLLPKPADVRRCATVSSSFRAAALSDSTWRARAALLPTVELSGATPGHEALLARRMVVHVERFMVRRCIVAHAPGGVPSRRPNVFTFFSVFDVFSDLAHTPVSASGLEEFSSQARGLPVVRLSSDSR
jgi:hypothetical protein